MDDEDLRSKLLAEFDQHITDDESENENLNIGFIVITFIWIQGLRANSKLMWVPDENNLYYANVQSREYEAMGYTIHMLCEELYRTYLSKRRWYCVQNPHHNTFQSWVIIFRI